MTVSTTASQTLSLSTPVLLERMTGQWRSLVYREALRMVAALRQIIAQSNGRSPVARSMLTQFNGVLIDIRRPVRADGCEPDLHAQELDFETSLRPWMELFHCHEITGVFVLAGIQSLRAFVHAGLLTDEHSPLSRAFVHDLVFALANVRFEPTVLEHDEIVMLELIDLLAELVEVAVAAIKSDVYSPTRLQNDEVVGETFVFQLLDLLFMLLNQGRFSELLRAKATDTAVELCALLFGCVRQLDQLPAEIGEGRVTDMTFPDISKPERAGRSLSRSGDSPSSVNAALANSIVVAKETDIGADSEGKPVAEDDGPLPEGFDPFSEENVAEDELAPDVVEQVMRFRAKLAGISLNSNSSSSESSGAAVFDETADRMSRHCLHRILAFLIRCIDIIETPGKKAPGSIKPDASAIPERVIPSVKTQTTALKCLLAIFTDPLSDLALQSCDAEQDAVVTLSVFGRDMLGVIGERLLRHLIGILALDGSSRHIAAVSQLLLSIFSNYRRHFPAQFEYFLSTCFSLVVSRSPGAVAGASTSGAGRSVLKPALAALKTTCLEMLAFFLQDASFIAQIFVVYECSPDFPNTLEQLTKCVSAGMERSLGNEDMTALSGEMLCNFIKTIETSLSRSSSTKQNTATLQELLESRRVKTIYKDAAGQFNAYPREAFQLLQEQGLLGAEPSPGEIATFLRRAQGLDKKILGEYLVKPANIEILRAFFSAFKFSTATPIDTALRCVLESFRLPGEAQQIDRIMECFSAIYYPVARDVFASQDACYILAFSTLMLNTDLHNPQVKHKMSLAEFVRNNRGINDGRDIDEDYLARLYHSIKTREIVMPEEHGGEEAFASQWNEVLRRAALLGDGPLAVEELELSPHVYGIVEIVWKPIITSLIPYINQQRPTGETIAAGPLEALRGIASLFEKFRMTDALEALLGNIWSVSNLIPVFSAATGNMIPRHLARLPGFRQVVELIVDIFHRQGDGLRGSWTNWCRLLIMLAESSLIGYESFMTRETVLFSRTGTAVSLLALMRMAHEGRQVREPGKPSFISSIGRLFRESSGGAAGRASGGGSPPAVSAAVAMDEMAVAARGFVEQLPLLTVLTATAPRLGDEAFAALLDAFCSHLRWNIGEGGGGGKRLSASSTAGLNWTEETLILLTEALITVSCGEGAPGLPGGESAAAMACRLTEVVWPVVFAALSRLALQDPPAPMRLCEHAIVGIGRLLLHLAETGTLTVEVFVAHLKFLCQLSPGHRAHALEPSLALLGLVLMRQPALLHSSPHDSLLWPPLFTILAGASKFAPAAPHVLRLMGDMIEGSSDAALARPMRILFPTDFFTEYVDLLQQLAESVSTLDAGEMRVFDPWRGGETRRVDLAGYCVVLLDRLAAALLAETATDDAVAPAASVPAPVDWSDRMLLVQGALARLAQHPLREVRQAALNALTRSLAQMSSTLMMMAPVFSRVLLPLLTDLRVRSGPMDETVMRSVSLATKTLLQHLSRMEECDHVSVAPLWRELLEALLLLLHRASDVLRESILESVKNVLLVMLSTARLQDDPEIWRVTGVLLDGPLPEWRAELQMRLHDPLSGEMSSGAGHGSVVETVSPVSPVFPASTPLASPASPASPVSPVSAALPTFPMTIDGVLSSVSVDTDTVVVDGGASVDPLSSEETGNDSGALKSPSTEPPATTSATIEV